jgi:hypothetical protein
MDLIPAFLLTWHPHCCRKRQDIDAGAWVAALFGYGLAFSPRVTRWVGGIFAIETVSDVLHIGYQRAKKELK